MSSIISVPKLVVEMSGQPLAAADALALGEVRVQQRFSLPTLCALTFYEPTGMLSPQASGIVGETLRLTVQGNPVPLFSGEVTAVEYEYDASQQLRVHVRGYDLLHRLRKRQTVGSHIQLNVLELVRTLVADLGVSVEAEDTGLLHSQLVQHNQTDLALLSEVAAESGLYFTLHGTVLHLLTMEGMGSTVPLELGTSLIEARIEANAEPSCSEVRTTGWNPQRIVPHNGRVEQARSGREVMLSIPSNQFGGSGPCSLLDQPVSDDQQAEALAQAELDQRVARQIVLRGTAEGDPRLQPGTKVNVSGLAQALCGDYILTGVNHIVDRTSGYITELDTAPPTVPERSRTTVVTWARVTAVDDPDQTGRIKVALPTYDDIETEWLQVVVPGAGSQKGLMALPNVDDLVLVLIIDQNPAHAVVLGGLYGTNSPKDAGVEDGEVRRFTFTTAGGQQIQLDDTKEKIRIENSNSDFFEMEPEQIRFGDSQGSLIEMTSELYRIYAVTDLSIEAPGKSITITGRAIDFEKAS